MLFGISAYAEESPKKETNATGTARFVVVGELLLVVNASLAAADPHIYGGALALLSPLGMRNTTEAASYVHLAAMESLAIYNLKIDPEKKSKGEIFRENMIGWHVSAAVSFAAYYFLSDSRKESERSVALAPSGDGWKLLYSKAF